MLFCTVKMLEKDILALPRQRITASAVTRIRTWVVSATTRSTNHYTITATAPDGQSQV